MRLGDWLDAAMRMTANPRASSPIYERHARHWRALTLVMVRGGDADEIAELLHLLDRPHVPGTPWGKPHRGTRNRTQWEWVNVEARNRLDRLRREADRESLDAGDNSRNAA